MLCPYCTQPTRIYNSRSTQAQTQTWRRHRCTACQRSFTTRERIDWNGMVQITDGSVTQPYSRERLLTSLLRASSQLVSTPDTTPVELCDTVERQLQKAGFFTPESRPKAELASVVLTVLHRYDPNMALQYLNNVYAGKPPAELLKRYVLA